MSTPSNAVPESFESQRVAPAVMSATQPMCWSVRRELWENRSIYMAPLAVAAIAMLGFLISLLGLPHTMHDLVGLDPARRTVVLAVPFAHVAMLLLLTEFLVGTFYSLDALYGERRDRSILFWKSLPVSDLTTVLSKAIIPLVVLPVLTFAITFILQVIMLVLSTAVVAASGADTTTMLRQLPFVQIEVVLLYSVIVLALSHAPIYGWLLLVSGWARRAPFLWAVLPPLAICVVEGIAFRTWYFGKLLTNRLFGFVTDAFSFTMPDGKPIDAHFIPVTQLTPGRFLSSPGLWIGLAFAAIFLAAAVRMRRYREPI
jgi:ABC-2 type transport system permease protein